MFRRRVYCLAAFMLGAVAPLYAAQSSSSHIKKVHAKAAVKATDAPKAKPSDQAAARADSPEKAAQKLQQTQVRQMQEAEIKAQQAQARYAEETQRLEQEQARQSQEVAHSIQTKIRDADEAERVKKDALRRAHQRELQAMQAAAEIDKIASQSGTKGEESKGSDAAELAFKNSNQQILHTSFSGPRKVKDRDSLPPINLRMISVQKAVNQPFLIRSATGDQRREMQAFQQNLQNRLLGLPAVQTPSSYAELKSAAITTYFNNYPAYVNHQALTINRKNTYIKEVPPTSYPTWYERSPGWTYCNSYVLGSGVQVNSDWFAWDWPAEFGAAPAGFLCQPEYFPTPWIYVTYNDHWRQSGDLAYQQGPDSDYTGPITVETVEPITAKFPDKFGVPVFQTINVVYFYNAFYQPEFERWGYVNKQGSFVWLNI